LDMDAMNRLYEEMEKEARESFRAIGVPNRDITLKRTADMRYVGQFHEVEVPMAVGKLTEHHVKEAVAKFHKRHQELYTFSMNFRAVEFLNFRLKATARKAAFQLEKIAQGKKKPEGSLKRRRTCIFNGKSFNTPVYDGERIRAGNVIRGPAIIEEQTTTVVVPPAFECSADRFKSYILRKRK